MTMQSNLLMKPTAIIRGDHLVMNLPDAVNPVVWQFDVARVQAASIEVRANDQHQYVLRLKSVDGSTQDIATYGTRDAAVHVLSVIHGAFLPVQQGSGAVQENMRTQEVSGLPRRSWIVAGVAFVLFVLMVSVLFRGASTTNTAPDSVSAPPVGVPLPADDVLRGRMP